MSSEVIARRSKRLKSEYMLMEKYKRGWTITNKYINHILDKVLPNLKTDFDKEYIVSSVNNFKCQLIGEYKSCNINYLNKRYYNDFICMCNTINKHINEPRQNSMMLMINSLYHLERVCKENLYSL